ncbi:hypothetical protein BDV41DRAFT_111846 [Aspergillus transmontanensis]|uniref:Uncharacterized protein n=1 Tax=Aspergillus transmontanensis TaxID=1034304 RepID=A0A5N6W6P1_9EURO|nr:hypothetical protein BDV41DRAFT_111846 [Aspergillus transmontanensis]
MNSDPFGRLPWFALQSILSNLPSLPALYSLYNASPEVAAFLHRNKDLFAQIIDAIISNPVCERGLAPHVQDILRLIIRIWTPIQEPDTDILGSLYYVLERPHVLPPMRETRSQFYVESRPRESPPTLKAISPSTPSAILSRLLRLMGWLRCLIHAYFHSAITRCLQLQLEHIPPPLRRRKRWWTADWVVDRSKRPKGIPYTPTDIGPLTWVEEQRLLSSFLFIVLFHELHKTHLEHSLFIKDSESVRALLENDVEVFWKNALREYHSTEGHEEQLVALLHWLGQQASRPENIYQWLLSGQVSEDYSHCCQYYTTVIHTQMKEVEIKCNDLREGISSRGVQSLRSCRRDLRSPLKGVDRSVFHPYGLVFWDGVRLDGLGFLGKCCPDLTWFSWSSIFTEEDWEDLQRRQSTITTFGDVLHRL